MASIDTFSQEWSYDGNMSEAKISLVTFPHDDEPVATHGIGAQLNTIHSCRTGRTTGKKCNPSSYIAMINIHMIPTRICLATPASLSPLPDIESRRRQTCRQSGHQTRKSWHKANRMLSWKQLDTRLNRCLRGYQIRKQPREEGSC